MTEMILKWQGTLDKFIGDAVMAFWNAPLKQENHAERAVRCALDMARGMDELRRQVVRRRQDGARLRHRHQHR